MPTTQFLIFIQSSGAYVRIRLGPSWHGKGQRQQRPNIVNPALGQLQKQIATHAVWKNPGTFASRRPLEEVKKRQFMFKVFQTHQPETTLMLTVDHRAGPPIAIPFEIHLNKLQYFGIPQGSLLR